MGQGDLVLVTGAEGFLAKYLIKDLLARGYRVRGTLRDVAKAAALRDLLDAGPERLSFAVVDEPADSGWAAAVDGCRYLMHLTPPPSPTPDASPDTALAAARDATVRVLEAAVAGDVERLVMTSSIQAIVGGHKADEGRLFHEADWAVMEASSDFARASAAAEKAAWEFAAQKGKWNMLVVINASVMQGPPLDEDDVRAAGDIVLLLNGKLPLAPKWGAEFVDVRDVATAHVVAMEKPSAGGKRFIVSGGALTLAEIAQLIGETLPSHKDKLPKAVMPNWLSHVVARFQPDVRALEADLGPVKRVSTLLARDGLGLSFRPPQEALAAMARGVVAFGAAPSGGDIPKP